MKPKCSKKVSEADIDPNRLLVSVETIVRGRAASVQLHVAIVWLRACPGQPPQTQGVQRSQRVRPRDHHALFDTRQYKIHIQAARAPWFSLALSSMLLIMLTRLSNHAGFPQDPCNRPHATNDELLNGIFTSDTSDHPSRPLRPTRLTR